MSAVLFIGHLIPGNDHMTWQTEHDPERVARVVAAYGLELGVMTRVDEREMYVLVEWEPNEKRYSGNLF